MNEDPVEAATADEARLVQEVLVAVAAMARRSSRSQADLGAAMFKMGLWIAEPQLTAVLQKLAASGLVENLIPLSDGATLLTVTPKGLQAVRPWG